MTLYSKRRPCLASWTAVCFYMVLSVAQAAPPDGVTPLSQPVSPPTTHPASGPVGPIREQTIYIPYTKLRETFEREGRGVFLPYGEFEKLWRAARDNQGPPPETLPPAPFLVSEVDNEATVAKDVVNVKAMVKLDLLAEGWLRVPLGLADAAITRATIGEQPARIVFQPKAGYQLLIEKRGKTAESVTLALEYAKAYEKGAGRNSVSFQAPQAPISRWLIRIPNAGAKVDIAPLIAATQVPQAEGATTRPSDETTVLAFVGAAPVVQIAWTPRAEGATGLTTLATVQAEQQVQIEDGVMRTRTLLSYEISRNALSELLIEVPADQRVINVVDANVRQWSVVPPTASAPAGEGRQRIAVQLFEPARKLQNVIVELERFVTEPQQRRLRLPEVTAIGVARQQGVVVVATAEGLTAEAITRTGLLQMDAAELPRTLAKSKWLFSYRYAALPFDLTLQIDKLQPRVTAESLVEASLEPERLTLDMLTIYTIERVGLFRLEFDVPVGYEIRKLNGVTVGDVQPVVVDAHYLEGPEKGRLIVNLASKAIGRVALTFSLQRTLTEADLLSPTGRSINLPLLIPRVAPSTVERAAGRLVIHAAESLRVNPGEVKGVRGVSFKEAFEAMPSMRGKDASKPVLAFAYAQEEVTVGLVIERRKPQVTVRQLLLARIEAGVIKYSATFTYEILYSGVPSVRIDVPAELAAEIRNNTPGIREKVIDPPPKDLGAGQVAWSFAGESELAGNVQIRLSWEKKLEELAVGKTIEEALPRLQPRLVDRAWGQIVWTKAETLDVHEAGEPKGVRPIDPQHDLQRDSAVADAARAMEFYDDWELRIAITRYKLEEVKRASIERAVVQMVTSRSGQLSVRGLYRVRSAGQRLAIKLPAGVQFDNEPLRINGKAIALERGDADTFFVPLVGLKADVPALLELRYSIPKSQQVFVSPAFPSEPAIQKVYLCVYLPEDFAWLGSRGPWTAEMDWSWSSIMSATPVARQSGPALLGWAREGLNQEGMTDTFQTDGRLHLFSALNPTASGDAALRLTVMNDDWFSAIVIGVVVLIGLVLVRFGAAARGAVIGISLVLLILLGVFLPTFSRQILGEKLALAGGIVLIVWAVQYLVWIRPRDPFIRARKQARQEILLARMRAQAAVASAAAPVAASTSGGAASGDDKGGGSNV